MRTQLTLFAIAAGLLCAAVAVSVADEPTALNPLYPPLFAIDPNTPHVNVGFSPGDVLFPRDGVFPPDPNVPIGPNFPIRVHRTIDLGLLRPDNIDGLSLPNIGLSPTATFALIFSVDRRAEGLVPPDPGLVAQGLIYNVQDQASKNQAAGDSFMGLRLFNRDGPAGPGLRGPGNNTLVINQGDAGGVDYRLPPNNSSPDPNLPPGGNVNAGAGSGAPGALKLRAGGRGSAGREAATRSVPPRPAALPTTAPRPRPAEAQDRALAERPLPIGSIGHIAYDLRTGEITPAAGSLSPRGPELCWDNTRTTGFFYALLPWRLILDWGDLASGCTRPDTLVFGYATDATQPINADLGFYFNESGFNSTSRDSAGLFRLRNLPGGTGGPGFYSGWYVTVTLPEPMDFTPGADLDGDTLRDFGYTFGFRQALPEPELIGPITASPDPNVVPTPAPGLEDAFDRFSVGPDVPNPPGPNTPLVPGESTNYDGTFWFGGVPRADFMMGLGRGVNPGTPLFFSLSRNSPSAVLQRLPGATGSGSDIYVDFDPNNPGGEFTWATPMHLGLQFGDDVDALTVLENGNFIYDNQDVVLFSLRRGSPTLPGNFAPGDVLVRRGFNPIQIYAPAESLGLIADRPAGLGDDMDMFDIAPCPDIEACVHDWGIRVFNCPGDVNQDLVVDLVDLSISLSTFGLCAGDPGYVPGADLTGDGCVNLADLAIVLANFGTSC